MNILHVVAGLPPGGGITEVVSALCRAQAGAGAAVTVATVGDGPLAEPVARAVAAGVQVRRFRPTGGHAVCYSWTLHRGLAPVVEAADLVHVHSNWTFPVWCACHLALRQGRPLVMTPHGCLDPVRLRHSAWKKQLVAPWFDNRYLRRADCLHATSEAECAGLGAYGLANPVALIPNGVDVDALQARPGDAAPYDVALRGRRILLFLSRLHPLKGVDCLVSAWAQVAERFPAWHLVVAGPDEQGCAAQARQEAQRRGVAARTTFCGPLHGAARRAALAGSELFVLPSRHENFGLVVAEAAALGKPVITTQGTPWSELAARGAGWWIPTGEAALAAALTEALAMEPAALTAKGMRARDWITATFAWPRLALHMLGVYSWLLRAAPRPEWVRQGRTPQGE